MQNKGFVVSRTGRDYRLFQEKQPLLKHFDVELTERCNNNCVHCYINLPQDDQKTVRRELSTDQWKDILKQGADLGALSVRFTGGEPLLREDFEDLYLFARRLGMKVIVFTNGRLITKDIADLFQKIPPLKKIEITSFGMHTKSYDSVVRVPGAYQEYQRGINLLLDRQIPFMVKSTLLPQNYAEIDEFEQWATKINGQDKKVPFVLYLDLRAHRDSMIKNQVIRKLRLTPEESVKFLSRNESDYKMGMALYVAKFMHPTGDKLFNCGAGQTGCVDAYGEYQMCMMLRHPDTVYDLTKGSMKEALTEVFPKIYDMRAKNSEYLRRCARCFLRGLCEQCPAKSWSEHGTLDTPVEYYCRVAHLQAEKLGLISKDEKAWDVENWQERIKNFLVEADLINQDTRESRSLT
jgi:radical SAM protein with 4Fe4S-binding SPASM domain